MKTGYPVIFTPAEDGTVIAQCVDVPEALTYGETEDEALEEAEDALVVALIGYVEAQRKIPAPSRPAKGQRVLVLPALVAAKLALYQTMREQAITNVELAKRLSLSEAAIRRLVDLDHSSKIEKVEAALAALGRRLIVHAA